VNVDGKFCFEGLLRPTFLNKKEQTKRKNIHRRDGRNVAKKAELCHSHSRWIDEKSLK
jgi:hypothetical protein